MLVETYEINEQTADGKVENEAEIKELVEKLGLEGQSKFFKSESGQVTVFPYRKMTKQEKLVYETLCPKESEIEEFDDSLIPLRVLQVISHVKDTGFIHKLKVWHPESADIKDPVLVGVRWNKKEDIGDDYRDREYYILARWGEELASFVELSKQALDIIKARFKKSLAEAVAEAQTRLASLDSFVEGKFREGSKPSVSFYCY